MGEKDHVVLAPSIPELLHADYVREQSFMLSGDSENNPMSVLLKRVESQVWSGGIYTRPETRIVLAMLALSMNAEDILETGYDAANTTEAFALTGAKNIVAIDKMTEYMGTEPGARKLMEQYENVTLHNGDALLFLKNCDPLSWDFMFIDDDHSHMHVAEECEEVDRILRPGGMVCFHDTISRGLWDVACGHLPKSYQRIEIPCIQVTMKHAGEDFGVGIFRKPKE